MTDPIKAVIQAARAAVSEVDRRLDYEQHPSSRYGTPWRQMTRLRKALNRLDRASAQQSY